MGAPLGNQNAAKAKRWSAAIDRALEKRGSAAQAEIDRMAEEFLDAVLAGKANAIPGWKEFGDRLEGKPAGSDVQLLNYTDSRQLTVLIDGAAHGDSAGSNLLTLPAREVQSPLRWAGVGQVVGDSESVAGDSVQQSDQDTVRERDPENNR